MWVKRRMQILPPQSRWYANCVRESGLMGDLLRFVVANSIDTERWRFFEEFVARELLGLPTDVPLLLFGAMGTDRDS